MHVPQRRLAFLSSILRYQGSLDAPWLFNRCQIGVEATTCHSLWQELVMWNKMVRYNRGHEAHLDDMQYLPCLHGRRCNACRCTFQWWIEDTNVSKSVAKVRWQVQRIHEEQKSVQERKDSVQPTYVIRSKEVGSRTTRAVPTRDAMGRSIPCFHLVTWGMKHLILRYWTWKNTTREDGHFARESHPLDT